MSPERGSPAAVLVTGASGFVGAALVNELASRGYSVMAAARRDIVVPPGVRPVRIGNIGPTTDWRDALVGCHALVHCAARVHVMRETAADPLAAFREVNVEGSMALARQAVHAGVRRMVFVSSVKVNGESSEPGRPFTTSMPPAPVDPYGVSKSEAETALRAFAAESRLELVIVRSPLAYGPGVKANFRSMVKWLERGLPLPFGLITENRRTLVALGNLTDLLITCVDHAAAPHETFFAGDSEDLSTADLLRRTGRALGRRAKLIPVPPVLLRMGARLTGRADLWQRLGGNLQVDIGQAERVLGWHPPLTVDEGLTRMVRSSTSPHIP